VATNTWPRDQYSGVGGGRYKLVLAAAYTRELAEARSWWKCANIADADTAFPA
jgi:hypothetical protein